jgi:hypothetical protein
MAFALMSVCANVSQPRNIGNLVLSFYLPHFQKIPKSFDIPPPKVRKTFFTGSLTFFNKLLWDGLEIGREREEEVKIRRRS